MVLFSSSSYGGEEQAKRREMIKLDKDLWKNDDGEIGQGKDGLPKGWAKGKLIARAGDEISDLEAKEYGLKKPATKATAPKENKSK